MSKCRQIKLCAMYLQCFLTSLCVYLSFPFLKAHLEDLAEKDATEKSNAAREAFLAELALDSRKGARGGNDSRHIQEKSKDKKKNREYKKAKYSKV